jgi:hypothetical protein
MQVAIKVAPEDLPSWTEGMQRVAAGEVDLAWGYALLPHEPRWAVAAQPIVYGRAGVIVAVFARRHGVQTRLDDVTSARRHPEAGAAPVGSTAWCQSPCWVYLPPGSPEARYLNLDEVLCT